MKHTVRTTATALATVLMAAASATACSSHASNAPSQTTETPAISVAVPGHPTLVSFLATQATGDDPSLLQITVLKSMNSQYSAAGLDVEIIDTSHATAAQITNFGYDWHLDPSIKVRTDTDARFAQEEKATSAPTTILLSAAGKELRRWNAMADSQDLAFALQGIGLASKSS